MLTSNRIKIFFTSSIALCVVIVYGYSFQKVHDYLDKLPSSERAEAFILSPAFLEIAAGEFKGLMADYLLLKGASFLGGRWETTDSDMAAIYTLFKQSLTLDPYFLQTCFLTQAFLAWRGNKAKEAIELLDISNNHRDWDWNPGFYIGFDYYYFLNENLMASKYLMEASKKPGATPLLAMLAARLSQKGGQTEAAIAFMKSMRFQTDEDLIKKQIDMRIKALEGVRIIEKGILRFKLKFNQSPKTIDDLLTAGVLSELPENPYKKPFLLEDGVIEF